MTRLPAALLLAVALAGAACGTTPTPTPAPTAAPPTTAPATVAPSAPATPVGARHADPTLEALLPTSLGGVSLVTESQRGTDLLRQSDALDAMLASLGKTLADFTIASAYSPAGAIKAQVGVWRVAGAAPAALLPAFVTSVQASSTTKLTVTELTLGGHRVTQIGAAGELTQGPIYAYAKDDLVLFVETPDTDLAKAALEALP